MKKLYLILLMLLILFIPATNAVAIYQLNQPVKELNGYTLREVFETNNQFYNIINEATYDPSTNIFTATGQYPRIGVSSGISGNTYYMSIDYQLINPSLVSSVFYNTGGSGYNIVWGSVDSFRNKLSKIFIKPNNSEMRSFYTPLNNPPISPVDIAYLYNSNIIDMTTLGIDNLTVEQMDIYYDLYLEAVRFEQENIQASQDIGGYQNIFRSVINGVKNLMTEMGNLWQFLNAPIMTSDIRDFRFEIDWSWDLIGMLGQVLSSVQVLTLQVVLLVPSLVFQLFGIPIQVSILSLLFSNFIFLVLGWIIVKSFLI